MKKTALSVILLLMVIAGFPQLQIIQNQTPAQLVQNTLVGYGVTVSNVTFTGSAQAMGKFVNGGTTNIGFTSGIVITSGSATNVIGPNTSGSTGTNTNGGSDPQLAALVSGTVYDAAALEFDFVPISDTIKFRYVFGSDEYPEFSNSSYNDVFGFFISGPNPNGGNYVNKNMAIIPGTTNTPVSINNINNGTSNSGPCMNCAYYVNNTNGLTIEYDGLTVVMTAWALVTPCVSYHFKAAIGDVGDHIYDSGVFLEANSFISSAVQISTKFAVQGAWKTALEGCNDALITAKLPKAVNYATVIPIDTMWGTATNGTDFTYIPDSIIVPAGTKKATIILHPLVDGVQEGTEYFNMKFQTSVCTVDTITIPIDDYTPIVTKKSPDTMVCGDTASLFVLAQYGIQPYKYDWTPAASLNNSNVGNVKAFPAQTTQYVIKVWDTTGCPPVYDTINLMVSQKPSVSFLPDVFNGCEPLEVKFADMSYPAIAKWDWNFGDGSNSNQQNPTHTYSAGVYSVKLSVETADGCKGSFEANNLINAYPTPIANFEAHPPITTIDNPLINFIDLSQKGKHYKWNFGDPSSNDNTSILVNPTHTYSSDGVYTVWLVLESEHGCVDSISKEVRVIIDEIEIPNIITPNSDGRNDVFKIKNIEKLEWSRLRIFNRWGKLIYVSENYKNDWDGNGAADGVYYYILDYKTYFRTDSAHGTVTIMRKGN
jgi:gliding motility-associated-like protein